MATTVHTRAFYVVNMSRVAKREGKTITIEENVVSIGRSCVTGKIVDVKWAGWSGKEGSWDIIVAEERAEVHPEVEHKEMENAF